MQLSAYLWGFWEFKWEVKPPYTLIWFGIWRLGEEVHSKPTLSSVLLFGVIGLGRCMICLGSLNGVNGEGYYMFRPIFGMLKRGYL